jgi:hypothetical protein
LYTANQIKKYGKINPWPQDVAARKPENRIARNEKNSGKKLRKEARRMQRVRFDHQLLFLPVPSS